MSCLDFRPGILSTVLPKMEGTILAPWAITLVIVGAVLIMTSLMILPPVALLIWRIHQMPEISLVGII
uniref:Uncharacterized protein n=1 Tax=Sarcophilus harrisii TaxID=9305 RepID=A0A7N4PDU9_SARHA